MLTNQDSLHLITSQSEEQYWKSAFEGVAPMSFPIIDYSHNSEISQKVQSKHTFKQLKIHSEKFEATPRDLIQASWSKVLSQYLGCYQIVFGQLYSPVDCSSKHEKSILPCVVDLEKLRSNNDLVRFVKDSNQNVHNHLSTSLEEISNYANLPTNTKLFDTLFLFEEGDLSQNGQVSSDRTDCSNMSYSVVVQVQFVDNILEWNLKSNNGIFNEESLARLGQQLDLSLSGILQNPEQSVDNIVNSTDISSISDLVSTELSPFQPTNKHLIKAELGHQWIEYQALNNPNEVGVRYLEDSEFTSENPKPEDWSYSKLNSYSNQIAQYLYSLGAQKRDYIVVSLPRIPTFYAALLAVMKVGGVYVPVDFQVPEDRRKMLVEESGAKFVISFDTIYPSNIVADTASAIYMNHEDICDNISQMPQNNLNLEIKGSDLSYLLFTSGTTGKPKGVMVTHSNLVSAIGGFSHVLPVHPKTRSLQFANCSFDVHLLDTFLAWSVGGAPCITDRGLMLNNMEFVIQTLGVTNCSLTSSVASYLDKSKLPNLEFITVGGESLSQQILDIWAPEGKLYNCYGPTEATIGCSVYPKVQHKDRTTNIGYLLHGCTGIILNPNNTELVLKGGVGELCIGGTYVADGYLNNEALTQEKFIDYTTAEGVQRFYRTGDLARFNSDGSIEFLGRKDLQVKINGIRIELEEISNNLTQFQSGLSVSTQYLSHPTQSKKKLVAFVHNFTYSNSEDQSRCTFVEIEDKDKLNQLLEFARTRLPIYMVPQYIFEINKVPMTPSGKVDSRVLAAMFTKLTVEELITQGQSNSNSSSTRELTSTESLIIDFIKQVTDIDASIINQDMSIFQVGLDSLSVIELASKLMKQNIQIPAVTIMQLRTISAISSYIDSLGDSKTNNNQGSEFVASYRSKVEGLVLEKIDLKQFSVKDIYPCIHLQQGMVTTTLASDKNEYISSWYTKLPKKVNIDKWKSSWEYLVEKYPIYRTGFFISGNKELPIGQVVLEGNGFDYYWKEFTITSEEELASTVSEAEKSVYSSLVSTLPPIRLTLINTPDEVVQVITLHHAVYDGWSLNNTLTKVNQIYNGHSIPEPIPFISFVEYVYSTNEPDFENFWSKYLYGTYVTKFPRLCASASSDDNAAANHLLVDSVVNMSEIHSFCKSNQTSPMSLAQAAFAKLLSAYIGENDVVFGHVLSGRTAPVAGVEDILGPCFNTIPCRVQVQSDIANSDLIKNIDEYNYKTMEYLQTSLAAIQRWAKSPGQPLFDTLFIFQTAKGNDSLHGHQIEWENFGNADDLGYVLIVELRIESESKLSWSLLSPADILSMDHLKLMSHQLDSILNTMISKPESLASITISDQFSTIQDVSTSEISKLDSVISLGLINPIDASALSSIDTEIANLNTNMINMWSEIVNSSNDYKSNEIQGIASCYILQPESLQLVAWGGIGELCFGGYLVSEESFSLNALDSTKYAEIARDGVVDRIYRTGDMARLNLDGTVNYIGRIDNQVKVNGIRVELDEVSKVLEAFDGINSAYTFYIQHPESITKHLVSFIAEGSTVSKGKNAILLNGDSNVDKNLVKLFKFAGQKLMSYMVPEYVFSVNTIPTNSDGQVDSLKLHQLYYDLSKSQVDKLFEKIKLEVDAIHEEWDDVSLQVRSILSEYTGAPIESIHLSTTIFQLGLDSLSSLGFSNKLKVFKKQIGLFNLMKLSTVKAIADYFREPVENIEDNKSSIDSYKKELYQWEADLKLRLKSESPQLDIDQIYPVTPLQQGMVYGTLSSEIGEYVNSVTYKLNSEVNIDQLKNSWNQVIMSHEILRTGFFINGKDSKMCQAVLNIKKEDVCWSFKSVQSIAEINQSVIEDRKDIQKTLLKSIPPMRLGLYQLEEGYYLTFTIHHSLYDGWSLPLILEDVLEYYYNSAIIERPKFRQVVEQICSENIENHKTYWQERLENNSGCTFPNLINSNSAQGQNIVLEYTSSVDWSILTQLSNQLKSTVMSITQFVWSKLLSQYSNQEKIAFYQVLSGRTLPIENVDRISGPCFNTVPTAVNINNSANESEIIQSIHQNNLDVLEHVHTPLSSINQWLGFSKDQPIANTLFIYQVFGSGSEESRTLWSTVDESADLDYSLSLDVQKSKDEKLVWYLSSLETVMSKMHLELIGRQLDYILSELINKFSNSQITLDSSILSYSAPVAVTSLPSQESMFMHSWLEKFAVETPESVALEFIPEFDSQNNAVVEKYTYGQFNSLANQIANLLIAKGVKIGDSVAVGMPKCHLFYHSMLAISKAGGVYVPFDIEAPIDRQHYLVTESNSKVVLTISSHFETLTQSFNDESCVVVALDNSNTMNELSNQSQQNLNLNELSPSDLAYILFTSGTTGKPKGVMVQHSNVTESMHAFTKTLPQVEYTKGMNFASCTFDVCISDTLIPLLRGGTVCSAPKQLMLTRIQDVINGFQATHIELTPSVAALVKRENVPSVKSFMTGGESITQALINEWGPGGKILQNSYGPTECTISCTINCNLDLNANKSSIGKGLENTWVFVMDSSNPPKPVLKGCIGELCIGGPLVAKGYLNRDDLTEEKFINYSHNGEVIRVYHTGDMVRLDHDDTITYFGRSDNQVKINGIRIEIDEISKAMESFEDVKSVHIGYNKHPDFDKKQLVSYILLNDYCDLSQKDIQISNGQSNVDDILSKLVKYTREQLPFYMVPKYMFAVNNFPITSSGKIDDRKLNQLYFDLSKSQILELFNEVNSDGDASNEVWDDISIQVRSLSSEYTGTPIETIRLSTSIFQLGLDSLSSIGFAAKLSVLGKQINLFNLMKLSTVGAIADYFRESSEVVESSQKDLELYKQKLSQWEHDLKSTLATTMPHISIEQVYPVTPLQQGMLYETLSSGNGEYINSTTFKLMPEISIGQFEKSWVEVIKKHEILRTGFFVNEDDSKLCQVVWNIQNTSSAWKFSRINDIAEIDQGVAQDLKDIESTLMKFIPPIRLSLYQLEQDYYLAFTLHHSLYDGWSLPLILEDVQSYYHSSTLPSRPKFREVVEYICSDDIENHKPYWQERLSEVPSCIFPTFNHLKVEKDESINLLYTSTIDWDLLTKLSNQIGATTMAITQFVWSKLLSNYCNAENIAFNQVLSGRTLSIENLSEVSGPCFNTVPTIVKMDKNLSDSQLISNIHQNNLQVLEHLHTPLSSINRWLGFDVNDPISNTLFIYQVFSSVSNETEKLWEELSSSGDLGYKLILDVEKSEDNKLLWSLSTLSSVMTEKRLNLIGQQLDYILSELVNQITDSNIDIDDSVHSYYKPPVKSYMPDNGKAFMHGWLERNAAEIPDSIGLEFISDFDSEDKAIIEKYTYKQLNITANQISRLLISKGVKAGDFVSLGMPKCPLFYISMMAISKSGATYVPFDIESPLDRQQYLISETNSKVALVLSEQYHSLKELFSNSSTIILPMDTEETNQELFAQSGENPIIPDLTSSHLAYVLFTSGTTGKPKGVMVQHSNIVESMCTFTKTLPQVEYTKGMNFASCTFDVCISDTLIPLLRGGTICSAPKQLMLTRIQDVINGFQATHIELTPSVAAFVKRENVPSVKSFMTGGESITQALINEWGPGGKILQNSYGPTECTISCTINCNLDLNANKSSIGKGLDNTWVFIMDSSKPPKPVLKGCLGELCIGGPLVAKGYLNREDLTQEKFINYNHNGEIIRVYCTGDVCSLNEDDSVTYFGRADTQVKVNGIRIELDEISNTLAKFDSELNVTTQYFKHPSLPKKKLISFVNYSNNSSNRATKVNCEIIKSENPGKFDSLYSFAKSQLPQYMIPQNIFEVNKIPITSAGKVDSKALLSLFSKLSPQQLVEEAQDDQNLKSLEELTATERSIVDAIAQITQAQISSIDPNMTIFQLGMDSLSAIRFSHLMKKQSHSISVYHAMKLASISNIADFLDAQKEQLENPTDDKLTQTVDFIKNFEKLMITEVSQKFELSKSEVVDQIYPCTPLQEAMIVSTLSSEHKEYINTTVMKLDKGTDLTRLNNAWNQTILNNETLRTGFFFNSNNQLCQVVTKFVPLNSWDAIKISEHDGFEELVVDSENTVFDSLVSLVPPVKFTVVNKSDEIFVIFTIHHALYDGWSLPLVLDNVIDAYNGVKLTSPPSYRSAVEYILSVDNQASQTFWSGYLKDLVPTQFPSLLGSKNEDKVAHEMAYTSKISMPEVIKACKKFKVTPLTLTQAAWSKFLSLLVGEKDIVFGNVLSGRTIPVEGVEQMTGPCFNTVACRVNLSDATSNLGLVQSIHKNNQEILNYVHTPLHSVLKWIGSSGAMELFNTLFLFQNNTVDSADEAGLWTDVDENGTINYDITIQIVTNGDSFNWEIVCQSHITNKDAMNLWGKQLDLILRDIIDNPNSDLTHLVPAYDGNSNNLELLSIDKPISPPGTYKFPYFHSGLEYYAEMNPDLMALHFLNSISEDNVPSFTNLTYRELNAQANQIANWLLNNLEVEDSVVMCLPRSPLSIVTAFAISKAGGVYVALDPEMPDSRKNYIVEESKAKFVLTNGEFLKDFEQSANIANVVDLDFVKGDIQAQSEENPLVPSLSPTSLSYMIFTSGTTGQPKGVEIEHHSLAEFIHYINESSGVFFGYKAMNFANVTFDVHILDLVGVVYAGGTICTSPRQLMLSRLQNVVEALKPDFLKLTPGVASLLNKQRIPFVKKLLAGGESLVGTVLNQWAPENQLVNCYGPTEVTIGCTFNFNVTKQDKTSNIGCLLKNCSGLIMSLEEPFRPVIRGGIGELCVGGPLVARGYLNRPDLTNEKFINYDVDGVTDRYYRTGDLCRFNLDGTIEYLGRFDDQVKLNGIRVELQEISKTINKCSNEFETKVVYITHPESSKKELVSFVYPKDKLYSKPDHTIKALELNAKLVEDMQTIVSQAKSKLPAYMVPYHWIPVDSISITMNGKVDMKKLKTLYESIKIQDIMELTSKFQTQDETASQWSEIQLIIREAISSVIPLDLDSVQPSTSFASMGVDSFNAIRVSSKLRQNGWGVSVGDLLQAGCIAILSQNMMNYSGKKLDIIDADLLIQKSLNMQKLYSTIEKDTEIDATNVEAILPITASQNIFLHSYQSSKFVDSVYTFALSSIAKLDTEKLNEAWRQLQTKNPIYRTSFITTESSEFPVVQVVSRSTDARFTVENIEESATLESIHEYYKDTNLRKFDLRSPPLSLKVLQYTDRTIILFSIMHALYDAFSIEDSFDQLVEFYSGNDALEPISYKNFVDYTASIPKDELEHFWKSQLSNISEAPVVCIPPEQQAQNIFLNKVLKFEDPEAVEKKLGQLGITLQALVIAAWSIVKSEVNQSSTVSFGLYRNGRQIPLDNIGEIVGPCVNVLPFVVDCNNSNLVELAKSVQLKLAVEGKYENANLHEVYNWTECKGSLYDTELNLLKVPEASVSESSSEAFSFENLPKDRAFSYIPINSDDLLSDVVPDAQLQTSISTWKTNFKHSLAFGIDNSLYKDGIQIGLMCDASHYTLQTLQSSYDNFVQLFYSIFSE